jgi:hypothetical protein
VISLHRSPAWITGPDRLVEISNSRVIDLWPEANGRSSIINFDKDGQVWIIYNDWDTQVKTLLTDWLARGVAGFLANTENLGT